MDMTIGELIRLALSLAGLIGGAAVWLWGRNQVTAVSSALAGRDLAAVIVRLELLDARLDRAGQKASDAADRVIREIAALSERLVRLETIDDGSARRDRS